MSINAMIAKQMQKSAGQITIVKVPADRRPTAAALRELDREIAAQVQENAATSYRSMLYASGRFSK